MAFKQAGSLEFWAFEGIQNSPTKTSRLKTYFMPNSDVLKGYRQSIRCARETRRASHSLKLFEQSARQVKPLALLPLVHARRALVVSQNILERLLGFVFATLSD
jgi:hypothetical protein